jgi:hypothetical protein
MHLSLRRCAARAGSQFQLGVRTLRWRPPIRPVGWARLFGLVELELDSAADHVPDVRSRAAGLRRAQGRRRRCASTCIERSISHDSDRRGLDGVAELSFAGWRQNGLRGLRPGRAWRRMAREAQAPRRTSLTVAQLLHANREPRLYKDATLGTDAGDPALQRGVTRSTSSTMLAKGTFKQRRRSATAPTSWAPRSTAP